MEVAAIGARPHEKRPLVLIRDQVVGAAISVLCDLGAISSRSEAVRRRVPPVWRWLGLSYRNGHLVMGSINLAAVTGSARQAAEAVAPC
jgi:hypothetical protein